jgi:RNA polymerase sigma factor (sigma-70 family)
LPATALAQASDAGHPAWDFAVEVEQLRAAGLTDNDPRVGLRREPGANGAEPEREQARGTPRVIVGRNCAGHHPPEGPAGSPPHRRLTAPFLPSRRRRADHPDTPRPRARMPRHITKLHPRSLPMAPAGTRQRDFRGPPRDRPPRHVDAGGAARITDLLAQYYPWLRDFIGRTACRLGLSPDELDDARHDAVLDLVHALAAWEADPNLEADYRSFVTFAALVLRRRFWNHLRGERRFQRHYERGVRADEWLAGVAVVYRADGRPLLPPVDEASDPARIAERNEEAAAVRRALAECPEGLRSLAERLADAVSRRDIAAEQGCPYGHVKWACHRLEIKFRPRLRDLD